ncbi:unnamed protein product, partial [Nesidiocoris tenuis]
MNKKRELLDEDLAYRPRLRPGERFRRAGGGLRLRGGPPGERRRLNRGGDLPHRLRGGPIGSGRITRQTILLPCPRTDKPLERHRHRHRHRHRGAKGRRHQPISDAFRTPTIYDGNGTANIRSRDLCRAVAVVGSGGSESVADWLMPSPFRSTVPVPLQRLVRSWAGEENGLTCDTALSRSVACAHQFS